MFNINQVHKEKQSLNLSYKNIFSKHGILQKSNFICLHFSIMNIIFLGKVYHVVMLSTSITYEYFDMK
jgi:hypothetical protein